MRWDVTAYARVLIRMPYAALDSQYRLIRKDGGDVQYQSVVRKWLS